VVLVERRDAEPGGAHGPLGGRDLLDCPADALVAGDDGAGQHRRQHCGPRRDPAAASSAVGIRRAILIAASRRGAAEPAERVHDSTLPPARARDHSSCFACG
jgi:hypothetical protein